MHPALLSTRLNLPASRPTFVQRPHLRKVLERGMGRRLTLISAPPGFGKTSLAAEWLRALGWPHAWLALDEDCNEAALFTTYLASALETLQPGISQALSGLLNAPQPPPPQAIATLLSNQLSLLEKPAVLALDDYHTIQSEQIHTLLRFLVDNQPPCLHLLLLTREDPPLPLARLRARSELVEIREADMRFSQAEAAEFLNQRMLLDLDRQSVSSLTKRTEGWIAGLQMAALALQAQPANKQGSAQTFIAAFRGDDRYIMDYLMDEVFTRQPAEIREFLLCTAILDRLCAPLCGTLLGEAAPGDRSSQSLLETLERRNLFLAPLDNRREWYRYHPLFADLLRYRLESEQPGRTAELHRCAANWYGQSGDPDDAMKHALAAGDLDMVASLAEQFMLHMTGASRLGTYLGWLKHIPEEIIVQRAYLCAGCAWAYVLTYQLEPALKYLQAGEAALPAYEKVFSTPERRWISGEEVRGNLEAIRSYICSACGDAGGAIEHAQTALQVLPPEAGAVRAAVALNLGMHYVHAYEPNQARRFLTEAFDTAQNSQSNPYVAISALSLLGSLEFARGKLSLAEGFFIRAIEYGSARTGGAELPSMGITHGWLVALHYQRNQLAQAQEHMDKVLHAAGLYGAPDVTARAYLYQELLAQERGELDEAERWQQRAEELLRTCPARTEVRIEAVAFRASLSLAQGDTAAAARLLAAEGVQLDALEILLQPGQMQIRQLGPRLICYLQLGRVLLGQGKFEDAARLLEQVSTVAHRTPAWDVYLEALALLSVATYQVKGKAEQALDIFGRALEQAAPETYVRPFLSGGDPIEKLLRQAITQGIQPGFAQQLLAALAVQKRQMAGRTQLPQYAVQAGANLLTEQLTERERQVLRLLAAGLSSTQVAEELVISVSTSRSYIKSLYGKLGAHSREEAIATGRQSGLL